MKFMVKRETLKRALKWAHRAFFACAVLLLGFCGLALTDSWVFEWRENRDLDLLRAERVTSQGTPQLRFSVLPKGLVGRIEIPRLRLSAIVMEGIGSAALRRGVGHIPGTALPGERGNVGLAGHRDTLFRPLKDLKINDEIRLSTPSGDFRYEVESLRIVGPNDTTVLAASGEQSLTLVTCYPFYYVGPAPQRWIVRARQVLAQVPAPSTVE